MQSTSTQTTVSSSGIIWLRLAIVYLMAGVAMGIAMGASKDFTLRPVHAHINLLGWTTMALAGLTYTVFPQAGRSWLAKVHFWLANLSMPNMAIALALFLTGSKQVLPLLASSEIAAAIGVIAFAANIFLNLKKA